MRTLLISEHNPHQSYRPAVSGLGSTLQTPGESLTDSSDRWQKSILCFSPLLKSSQHLHTSLDLSAAYSTALCRIFSW